MATANATVMFTDIRGFTARTSRDSREGLEELLTTHEELLLPVIRHYDGRVVKTIGDAFLVVFESPTNAVLCGVMIQRRLLEFNRDAPEGKRIEIRVAVNSGEVTLRGNDVFGEPVNICARIEGITEPNEIYFTEATYLTMQKAEVPSSEVGLRRLKGIPEEIKLYRVIQDEDNDLYRAIVEEARIVEGTPADVVGGLSIPQWPPPRGHLRGRRASAWPVLVTLLVIVLLCVGYLLFRSHQEAHRYDAARDALAARSWAEAQDHAGELWGRRGDDPEAARLLTEAIAGELDDLVRQGDPQALEAVWAERKLAWAGLPAREELDLRVTRARLGMQIEAGDAAGALEALARLQEADPTDGEVSELLVRALRRILVVDPTHVRDQPALDAWTKRFGEHSERYRDLPGFDAVRADAAFGVGMALAESENNFHKDAGIQLLRTFLQEQPDDRDRGFRARVRLVSLQRWHGHPSQLGPYLEEDPARAAEPGVRDAVFAYLSSHYDLDDEEDVAARALAWKHWGSTDPAALRAWLGSDDEKPMLNAFLMLRDGGALGEEDADRVTARILLHLGRSHEAELSLALDHWGKLLAEDPSEAETRAGHAVPVPLDRIEALACGAQASRERASSDAEWRAIVARCFYEQAAPVLLRQVVESASAGERKAAREILAAQGALTDALRSRSHETSLRVWSGEAPTYLPEDVREAVAFFTSVDKAKVRDAETVRALLGEAASVAADNAREIEKNARLTESEKRRRARLWHELGAAIQAALEHIDG